MTSRIECIFLLSRLFARLIIFAKKKSSGKKKLQRVGISQVFLYIYLEKIDIDLYTAEHTVAIMMPVSISRQNLPS